MGPGHLGRVLAISQGWWFRYHHGAKTRTEYEQVYEPEPDRTGLDWTRPEAGTGPDRTRSQKPEAGSRRPEAGLDQKPDQTGSRTGLETVLSQQYSCNSTVATVLLQQYSCNSTVATVYFNIKSNAVMKLHFLNEIIRFLARIDQQAEHFHSSLSKQYSHIKSISMIKLHVFSCKSYKF